MTSKFTFTDLLAVVGVFGLIILLLLATAASAPSEDDYLKVLSNDGFENITLTGYRLYGCSEDDFFNSGFEGTKNNRVVSGLVCRGAVKGFTIRQD